MNHHTTTDRTAPGRRIEPALLVALLLLLAPAIVSAQPTTPVPAAKEDATTTTAEAQDDTVKLDKFVVTTDQQQGYSARQAVVGSRIAKDIIDIASTVNVATPELISDLGGTSGPLAVTFVSADIRFNDNTDDGATMRGFASSGTLRNGISYIWYKNIPLYDVERIEVVKGPANMLLGGSAGSTGGAINYVTKLPTPTFQTDAKVTIGTHSFERFEANVSGPLTKSKDFTALYRLTVGQEHGDPVRPMNKLDDRFVGGALRFDFGDRIRLDFNGYYLVDNSNDYWPAFLDVVRSVPHGPAVLNRYSTDTFGPGRPDQEFWDTNSHALDLTLTMSLTDDATFRLNYSDLSGHDKRRNLRGGAVQADNVTLTRQDVLQYLFRYTRAAQAEFLYQTVRTTWRNDFQVGAEFRQSYDRTYDDLLTAPSLDTSNPDLNSYNVPNVADWDHYYYNLARNTQKSNLSSYWAQDHLTLFNDRVVLVGGLRWNSTNSVAEKGNPVILPGNLAGPYVLSREDDPVVRTHRYGIVVKPLKDFSIYYTDAQNSTPVPGFDSDGTPFKNTEGTLRELGAKLIRGNEHFSFSGTIAAYDMAQTEIRISIIDATVPGGIRYTQDHTGDTSKGWETELVGRMNGSLGHLDLLVNYSHGRTRRAIDGLPATNAPDTTESVFLKYAWTGGILKGLAVGAGMYDESVINTGAYTIDQPAIYNIMARYELSPRWAFQLNGTNVTDRKYLASVLNSGLVQVAPRADYRLSAKYTW